VHMFLCRKDDGSDEEADEKEERAHMVSQCETG
jgi:hypothetical protein